MSGGCGQGKYESLSQSAVSGAGDSEVAERQNGPGGKNAGQEGKNGSNNELAGTPDEEALQEVAGNYESEQNRVFHAVHGKALPLLKLSTFGTVVSSKEAGSLWLSEGKVNALQLVLESGQVSENTESTCAAFEGAVGAASKSYTEPFYPVGLNRCWNVGPARVVLAEREGAAKDSHDRTVFRSVLWSDLGGFPSGKKYSDLSVLGVGEDFLIMGDSEVLVTLNISDRISKLVYSIKGLRLPRAPDSAVAFREGESQSLLLTLGDDIFMGRRNSEGLVDWSRKKLLVSQDTPLEGAVPGREWIIRAYVSPEVEGEASARLLLKAGERFYRVEKEESSPGHGGHADQLSLTAKVTGFLESHCVSCHSGSSPMGGFNLKPSSGIDESFLRLKETKDRIRERMSREPGEEGRMPPSADDQVIEEEAAEFLDLLKSF